MTASSKPPFAGEARRVRLGDVCELTMGQSPSSDTYNREGVGLPFFQGNADFGAVHPLPSVWCSAPRKMAEPGDILLSVRAPIGEVNIANVRCCIGRGIAALRLNSKCIETAYLCAQILTRKALLESMGTGSTFKAVGKKTLESFPLVVHSRERQSLVVEQFDGVSRCLDLARRQLSLLDDLVKSRFVEMFGDPVENPMGWEVSTIHLW